MDGFVLKIAEWISPPMSFRDSAGNLHTFRKFLLLGNFGITDVQAYHVIVPPNPDYNSIEIDSKSEKILGGSQFTGWDVYSLTGEKLKFLPPMSLREALAKILDEE